MEILLEFPSIPSSQAEATLVDVTYSKECSEQMVTVCQPGYGGYGGKWPGRIFSFSRLVQWSSSRSRLDQRNGPGSLWHKGAP